MWDNAFLNSYPLFFSTLSLGLVLTREPSRRPTWGRQFGASPLLLTARASAVYSTELLYGMNPSLWHFGSKASRGRLWHEPTTRLHLPSRVFRGINPCHSCGRSIYVIFEGYACVSLQVGFKHCEALFSCTCIVPRFSAFVKGFLRIFLILWI